MQVRRTFREEVADVGTGELGRVEMGSQGPRKAPCSGEEVWIVDV